MEENVNTKASANSKILPATKKSLTVVKRRNRFGESLLHEAVLSGDVQLLKDILKLRPNVNMADNTGRTALHEAAVRDQYEACLSLINAGALVNIGTRNKVTPLHEAITFGNKGIVELLLKNGAQPPLKTMEDETALGIPEKRSRQVQAAKTKPKDKLLIDTGRKLVGAKVQMGTRDMFDPVNSICCAFGEKSDSHNQQYETSDDDSISLLHGIAPVQSRGTVAGLEIHHQALETINMEQKNRMEINPLKTSLGTEQENLTEYVADCESVSKYGRVLSKRQLHKRDGKGETVLHRACRRGETSTKACRRKQPPRHVSIYHTKSDRTASVLATKSVHGDGAIILGEKDTMTDNVMFSEEKLSYPLDKSAASRCSVQHDNSSSTQEALTTVPSSKTHIMKIKTVHLLADEELIPNAVLDSYWQRFLQNDAELECGRTVPGTPSSPTPTPFSSPPTPITPP
ncbi:uncharacterized protein LOC144049362 isoform X2 [Vanacampus margaritifer]